MYFFESKEVLVTFRDSKLAKIIPDTYEATEIAVYGVFSTLLI